LIASTTTLSKALNSKKQ